MPFIAYAKLKKAVRSNAAGDQAKAAIIEIHTQCAAFLATLQRNNASSLVTGKNYFVFENDAGKRTRAVNPALYDHAADPLILLANLTIEGAPGMSPHEINAAIYKLTISFSCTCDIKKTGDQQSPGKYFEQLVAHLISRRLGVLPRAQMPVFSIDDPTGTTTLPTNLIFDLGNKKPKFHVPVKTSTRERVIQVWAHQRVLDGAYGTGRFIGILVCLAETKTESATLEVIEICLPDQWRIYQSFIAQMRRIYYLDIPAAYVGLDAEYPNIRVREFGTSFEEADKLADEG